MTTKLHQIVAVVNGQKTRTQRELTDLHHKCGKPDLFMGIERRYSPKDEDGEQLPPESRKAQANVNSILDEANESLLQLFESVELQDVANCLATADIVVGDKTIARNVPVTHLLFLEKQLQDIKTFVSKLPTLDAAETWKMDQNTGLYATAPATSVRTKKVLRNHVKAEATKEHPAQVEVYSEDVQIGTWATTKFSGALPETKRKHLVQKVDDLIDAVKKARQTANEYEVMYIPNIGSGVLEYIFGNKD